MWLREQITFELDDLMSGDGIVTVRIATPAGTVDVMGEVGRSDTECVMLVKVHIQGLTRNESGAGNLKMLGELAREHLDVDELIMQGGRRTSGANPNRYPK